MEKMMQMCISLFGVLAMFVLFLDQPKIISASPTNLIKREVQRYTTRYDNVDVDRILQSRRLLLSYINCLLEKGPCSPDGKELKKYVPDALSSDCIKCSDIQRKQAGKVFSHLLLNYRDQWNQLLAKYDPDGNYRKKYNIDGADDYSDLDVAK